MFITEVRVKTFYELDMKRKRFYTSVFLKTGGPF